ncbi:MAG: phosphoribosylamine--glycine ligase [Flavobacteriales bacterium]|nr:phosphoribosylamine--glycine ligase [Flavobacteriales bacterium]
MNVLVLGSGGREHALAWKIAQDKKCNRLYVAPGNSGTAEVGTNIDLNPEDFDQVAQFAAENKVELIVVGPEAPLVGGIRDYFDANDTLKSIRIIGPGRDGARLEGSKDFAKTFMQKHDIPTASYQTFAKGQVAEAKGYLESIAPPYVLKADGLAGGKGVLILDSLSDAQREMEEMLSNAKFGEASSRVVVEAFLDGRELSVFALTDGSSYVLLPNAKDYKRIGEGDSGLNTGGMGAISPVPFADAAFMEKVENRIVKPTVEGLKADGIPYIGFLFFGLIEVNGEPFVIEYNVRMGDPETEVVMPRIDCDFLGLLDLASKGELHKAKLESNPNYAATVVMVSKGYPGKYEKGKRINGLNEVKDATVFHAGSRIDANSIITSGGRVLAVTGMSKTMEDALKKAYNGVEKIDFEGATYRRDIGFDL